MTVKGVLFDFSGTLMCIEPPERWLRASLDSAGVALAQGELLRLSEELAAAGAQPGGTSPRTVPPALRELWAGRDRSAHEHRALFTGLARQVPLPHEELYDALYDRHKEPEAWCAYPDTHAVLARLRERRVPVCVVSNIGWDLRPVLEGHRLTPYVTDFVLSYEHGVQKPDPRLFRAGCAALGLAPQDVLMVGDDAVADAGAADIGCAVHLVRHLPPGSRPDGLLPVLDLAG